MKPVIQENRAKLSSSRGRRAIGPPTMNVLNKEDLDRAVQRSREQCPGGDGCRCCGPGCNCGCRNDCPKFRYVIWQQLKPSMKGFVMHYRNGREAKNGDKIVQIGGYGDGAQIVAVGVLYDAKPGNDFCNGNIAPIQNASVGACMCDCLHLDDVAEMLKEKGLDKRPEGK